jgi:hypothetical protein
MCICPSTGIGFDFIIPILLNTEVDSNNRHGYSFIGIQVKTVAEYFHKEVAGTILPFIMQRCLKHMECVNGNHHYGCVSDEEYEEIIANQLTLILCADKDNVVNNFKGCFYEKESLFEHEDALESDEDFGNDGSKEIAEISKFSDLNANQFTRTEFELQKEILRKITFAEEVASKLWPKSMKDFKEEYPICFNYSTYSELGRSYIPDLLIENVII